MRSITLSLFAAVLALTVFGQSNTQKISIGGHFGITTMAMTDLNTYIDRNLMLPDLI